MGSHIPKLEEGMARFMSELWSVVASISFLLFSLWAFLSSKPICFLYFLLALIAAREAYVNYYAEWALLLSVLLTLIAIVSVVIYYYWPDPQRQSLER